MGLDAASFPALWALYSATGIRPEWVLPSLAMESGLNPSADNGVGYYGLNQMNGSQLQAWGINPSDYVTWAASQQITNVVKPWFVSLVKQYGPLRSATRVEQANFLPATLTTAKSLSSVIAASPSAFYESNLVFDPARKGTITVQDIANAMVKVVATQRVQNAISSAYAVAPFGEWIHDPVYGDDFGMSTGQAWGTAIAIVSLAGAVAYALTVKPVRRRRYA